MAYTPPNGAAVGLDLTGGYSPPTGASTNLEFDASFVGPRIRVAGGFDASALPAPSLRLKSRTLKASGHVSSIVPRPTIDKNIPRIKPSGIDATAVVGTPTYVRWRRFLSPKAIEPPSSYYSVERVRLPGGYNPPPAGSVAVNWFNEPYSPPPAGSVLLEFGALGYGYVWPAMGDQSFYGRPTLVQPVGLRPTGIASLAFGVPAIQTFVNSVRVTGFSGLTIGAHSLTKSATALLLTGINSAIFGTSRAFNFRQYLLPTGIDSLKLGSAAYVQGGKKTVPVAGINSLAFGLVTAINTRATRTALPAGFLSLTMGAVKVSPRIVYPLGIAGAIGVPAVQRNPSPLGFETLRFSSPRIEYKTKHLLPLAIAPQDTGFPRVFDPSRKVAPTSVVGQGIFGDVLVKNRRQAIRTGGQDESSLSPWAYVENKRRFLPLVGFNSLAIGSVGIRNKTPSLRPIGFDSLRAGQQPGIGYRTRHITLAGINSVKYGAPVVTKTPQLSPAGFAAGAVGVATVWPRIRNIQHFGYDTLVVGKPIVGFSYRHLPVEGFASDKYGTVRLERDVRSIAVLGFSVTLPGSPSVTRSPRLIQPQSIFVNFATGHKIGGTRWLLPLGFDAARFGARIIPEIQATYPLGFVALLPGLSNVRNNRQRVVPTSITSSTGSIDTFGTGRVFNHRQFVSMYYDPDSGLNPPYWSQWTLIVNRTRIIGAIGQVAMRMPSPLVRNNARLLEPVGVEALIPPSGSMVAYRVRPILLDGIESPYMAGWGRVFNSGRVLAPPGKNTALYGRPVVVNTRRYFNYIGGFDSAWFGYPFIAPRIRTLTFEGRYTIAPPIINPPAVKLHTRYVAAIGKDILGVGNANVEIHWTKFYPRWTHHELFGTAAVRNLTPELYTRGRNSEEFGDPFVRLQWRGVKTAESYMTVFGRVAIADKRRTVTVSGMKAWAFGDKLTVVKTGAPPYSLQNITLEADAADGEPPNPEYGYGIPPPGTAENPQVSRPVINQQVVYVSQLQPSTQYGNPSVTANGIRVQPGIQEFTMGEPLVSLRVRTLVAGAFPSDEVFEPSKAHVSPQTIWAVMEAPQQAIDNHTPQRLHYVDGLNRPPGVIFGRPTLTLQHRKIPVYGGLMSVVGSQTAIANRRKYVRPTGFTSYRAGWHSVPGPQTIEQYDPWDGVAFGKPGVKYGPYFGPITVRPQGLLSQSIGKASVDLFRRYLRSTSFVATQMGGPSGNTWPFMWQGLRVGPLVPNIPEGRAMDQYGAAWVSLRVRELGVEGFDSFLSEYQLEEFDKRLRVRNASSGAKPTLSIAPVGIYAFTATASDVRLGRRFIRPDGNADQHRKGAF